ncbi:MAG: anti-sigma factor [Gammaproteobacteria bacterium]
MAEPGPQGQLDDAMMDLLVKQVTEGLSPAEQRALDVLDSAVASANLRQLERAAAAVALAGCANAPPLPADLARRIEHQALEHYAGAGLPGAGLPGAGHARPATIKPARWAPKSGNYGWLAAAACLLLAVFAWNRSPHPAAPVAAGTPAPAVIAPLAKPPTAAEEREAMLAKSDSLKLTLGATKDPAAAGVSGDVVWDPVTQRGFLHFVGLAPNDPALRQYQLWIFDGGRDQRYPVDGGVFDIPANATEVVIPIHAALPVLSAKAFAVTVEKPGGVVVSGREHVVVLGAAS